VWTADYDLSEQPNQAASEPPTPPEHVGSLAPTTHVIDAIGFPVTVTGHGFTATSKASLDGVELATTYGSPTSLTATVAPANMPAAAGTGYVSVGTSNKVPLAFTATAARTAAPEPKAEPKQPERRGKRF